MALNVFPNAMKTFSKLQVNCRRNVLIDISNKFYILCSTYITYLPVETSSVPWSRFLCISIIPFSLRIHWKIFVSDHALFVKTSYGTVEFQKHASTTYNRRFIIIFPFSRRRGESFLVVLNYPPLSPCLRYYLINSLQFSFFVSLLPPFYSLT